MTISRESFDTLLKHDKEVLKKYLELKQRINGLLKTLIKIKIMKQGVREELDAYIKLIKLSLKEIEEGNKEFEKWTVNYLDSLPKLSDKTKDKLDEFKERLGTRSYDEAIQELFNLLESYYK